MTEARTGEVFDQSFQPLYDLFTDIATKYLEFFFELHAFIMRKFTKWLIFFVNFTKWLIFFGHINSEFTY